MASRCQQWTQTRSRYQRFAQRIQRLEREQAALRAQLEGERQLRILAAQIVGAAQIAPVIGAAVESFAQAMRAPIRRGRAGGVARARRAWRYLDGTFMPESTKAVAFAEEYERYAAGGRARAARARRASDGTFLGSESWGSKLLFGGLNSWL